MQVFMTGATWFIGSAVVQELLAPGHTVLGLARNDASAGALRAARAARAEMHRGDLEDMGALATGVKSADAVIHAGFIMTLPALPRFSRWRVGN